jgi:Arm DNA-binding domain
MSKLTKRTVDALTVTGKDYLVWDDEIPGFGVRILPSGRKGYVVQYKVGVGAAKHAASRWGSTGY